jgi:hypothetical protein
MIKQIIRCPYCVLGHEFRPLVSQPDRTFLCPKCGHAAEPGDEYFQCSCPKCSELRELDIRRYEAMLTMSELGGTEAEHPHTVDQKKSGPSSYRISSDVSATKTPADIQDELCLLVEVQIESFRQPARMTASEIDTYLSRARQIRTLCQELDRIGTRRFMEQRLERAS